MGDTFPAVSRWVGAVCATALVSAACAGGGQDDAAASTTTPAPTAVVVPDAAAETAAAEAAPTSLPNPGEGGLSVDVVAVDGLADVVAPIVRRETDDADLLADGACEPSADADPTRTTYECPLIDQGRYAIGVDTSALAGDAVTIDIRCSTGVGGDEPAVDVVADETSVCTIDVAAMGFRIRSQTPPEDDRRPIVRDQAGGAPLDCPASLADDGWTYECWGLPRGRYEVTSRTDDGAVEDVPYVCVEGQLAGNGPGYDGSVVLAEITGRNGLPQDVWTCNQDTPVDDLPGELTFDTFGPPSLTEGFEPVVLQGDEDVFDTACAATEGFSVDRGVTYECPDLVRASVAVSVPEIAGASMRCDAVTEERSQLDVTIDLRSSARARCSVSLWPPTLAVVFPHPASAPDDAGDGFVVLDENGRRVRGSCELHDEPERAERWLFCVDVAPGTYEIPSQSTWSDGPTIEFACGPGFGVTSAQGRTNIATVSAEPTAAGDAFDLWTCFDAAGSR